jgi:hypothetical protein
MESHDCDSFDLWRVRNTERISKVLLGLGGTIWRGGSA